MRKVFADTHYWIAVTHQKDQWHKQALNARSALGETILFTTDEVLIEFLNFFACQGSDFRKLAVKIVHSLISNPNIHIIPQTRGSIMEGLKYYENRIDKEYSLTDCISMNAMRTEGINEILTNDHHFEQEGFLKLY